MLLLIAMAVASAIVVYAFVTGLISGLSSGVGSGMITATASLTIPFGSGAALLVVSVTDDSNSPITGIQVTYGGFEDSVALRQAESALGKPQEASAVPEWQAPASRLVAQAPRWPDLPSSRFHSATPPLRR